MTSLTDTIKQYLTSNLVLSVSKQLNENENSISKALGSMTATLFSGIIAKSQQARLMERVYQQAAGYDGAILDSLGTLVNSDNLAQHMPLEASENLVTLLFEGKSPAVINAVAAFSGVKHSSASVLSAGLAGPLTLGILNRKINQEQLTQEGMVLWLEGQKNQVVSKLPGGVAVLIGLPHQQNQPKTRTPAIESSWFWALLTLLLAGAAIVWYMRYQ